MGGCLEALDSGSFLGICVKTEVKRFWDTACSGFTLEQTLH